MKKLFFVVLLISLFISIKINADTRTDIQRYIFYLKKAYPSSDQLVIVLPEKNSTARSRLYALEKNGSGWQIILDNIPATNGSNGFAPPGDKEEGDGKTPSGIFKIAYAFGYGSSCKTGLYYRQATEKDFWIDDPRSDNYNKWVTGYPVNYSHEKMKRKDHLYKYGIVIDYNQNPIVKGKGSAIFIHVWRSPGKPTSGCVAISEDDIKKLLSFLDREKKPVIMMGLL